MRYVRLHHGKQSLVIGTEIGLHLLERRLICFRVIPEYSAVDVIAEANLHNRYDTRRDTCDIALLHPRRESQMSALVCDSRDTDCYGKHRPERNKVPNHSGPRCFRL